MRQLLFAVAILGAGVAIGWMAAPPRRAAASEAEPTAQIAVVAPGAELDRLRAERGRLEAENDELAAQVTSLLDQQAQWLESVENAAPAENVALAPPAAETPPRGPWGDDEASRARREEFMLRNQERMQQFQDSLATQLTDPASIEAFNVLMEWQQYQRDLRGQLRDAQTDEERDAIQAKMDEARDTARGMVEQQQNAVLRGLAAANGIAGDKEQEAFVASMKQTLNNPFFSLEGLLIGGGPPGRGFSGGGGFPRGSGGGGRGRPSGQFRSGSTNGSRLPS